MKKTSVIVSLGATLLVFGIAGYIYSDFLMRRDLKRQCDAGMDCECFANVVDNRLTRDQVRAFSNLLTSIKTRQNASILEFTDEANASKISGVLSICRKDKYRINN